MSSSNSSKESRVSSIVPETYEKDGIIYFKEPYLTDYINWIACHLDCDLIAKRTDNKNSEVVEIICYAKSEEYNNKLFQVQKERYPSDMYCRGMSSDNINWIRIDDCIC